MVQLVSREQLVPVVLSIADACRYIGLSRATFYKRLADGTLPAPVKIGGRRLIRKADLDAIIAQPAAA
jgi:excisionase family DNA binding protein